MRIIGGNDYYDSAIAYGIDPGVVFVRDGHLLTNGDMNKIGHPAGINISITTKEDMQGNKQSWRYRSLSCNSYGNGSGRLNDVRYAIESMSVIFCGKNYRGLMVTEETRSLPNYYYFWNLDKFTKWCDERDLAVDRRKRSWVNDNHDKDPFRITSLSDDKIQALIDARLSIVYKAEPGTGKCSPGSKEYLDWLTKDSGHRGNCDGLKEIHFQSALDPYTAFQELSMWVGGTLSATNGPNTVTITDNDVKIAKHGFDKRSFRNMK